MATTTETFTGTAGAVSAARWVVTLPTTGTGGGFTLSGSGTGLIKSSNGGSYLGTNACFAYTVEGNRANGDIRIKVTTDNAGDSFFNVLMRNSNIGDGNGYRLVLDYGIDLIKLTEAVGGISGTTLVSTARQMNTGQAYQVHVQAEGTTLRASVWPDGQAEPAWMLTATDATYTTGRWGIAAYGGSAAAVRTMTVDDYVLSDLGVATGTSRPQTVTRTSTGTVGRTTGAARPTTVARSASGTVAGDFDEDSVEVEPTVIITASGELSDRVGDSSPRTATVGRTASGRRGVEQGSARPQTVGLVAAGGTNAPLTGGTVRGVAAALTASGRTGHAGGASLAVTAATQVYAAAPSFLDDFVGTAGPVDPADWDVSLPTSGTGGGFNLNGTGKAVLSSSTTGMYAAAAQVYAYLNRPDRANGEIRGDVVTSNHGDSWLHVIARNSNDRDGNGYRLILDFPNDRYGIEEFNAATFSSALLGAWVPIAFDSNTAQYLFRFRILGSTLSASAWLAGTSEPAVWGTSVTDTTYTTGRWGLAGYPGGDTTPRTYTVDSIQVTDVVTQTATTSTRPSTVTTTSSGTVFAATPLSKSTTARVQTVAVSAGGAVTGVQTYAVRPLTVATSASGSVATGGVTKGATPRVQTAAIVSTGSVYAGQTAGGPRIQTVVISASGLLSAVNTTGRVSTVATSASGFVSASAATRARSMLVFF